MLINVYEYTACIEPIYEPVQQTLDNAGIYGISLITAAAGVDVWQGPRLTVSSRISSLLFHTKQQNATISAF